MTWDMAKGICIGLLVGALLLPIAARGYYFDQSGHDRLLGEVIARLDDVKSSLGSRLDDIESGASYIRVGCEH